MARVAGVKPCALLPQALEKHGPRIGEALVRVDPRYFRPTEVDTLVGDASLAREKLGWRPKTSFEALVAEMAAADLMIAKKERLCMENGFEGAHEQKR